MRKKQTITVVEPAKPLPQPVTPPSTPYWRSVMTDHNGDFDLGALLVAVVILVMCAVQAWEVYQFWLIKESRGTPFNPQQFGLGIGAVLAGFAAYKWGDARRPPPSTLTATAQTVT